MSSREISLRYLEIILAACEMAERDGLPTIKMSHTTRSYLMEACARAITGHSDPLGLKQAQAGRPSQVSRNKALAAEVVLRREVTGEPLELIFESLGDQYDLSGRDGGAVEKAYKDHNVEVSNEIRLMRLMMKHRSGISLTDAEREESQRLLSIIFSEGNKPVPPGPVSPP